MADKLTEARSLEASAAGIRMGVRHLPTGNPRRRRAENEANAAIGKAAKLRSAHGKEILAALGSAS